MSFRSDKSDSDSEFDHITIPNDAYFAFARIKGDVFLIQASSSRPVSALAAVEVKVFRHEFISIFRFSETRTLHPADICILEPIDDRLTRYEEDSETVFLARNVMERMRRLTDPRWNFGTMGRNRIGMGQKQFLQPAGLAMKHQQRQRQR